MDSDDQPGTLTFTTHGKKYYLILDNHAYRFYILEDGVKRYLPLNCINLADYKKIDVVVDGANVYANLHDGFSDLRCEFLDIFISPA